MGKFKCHCGYVISDVEYPCPWSGDLKWEPQSENASQDASEALKEFFAAIDRGEKDKWLRKFFSIGDVEFEITKIRRSDARRTTRQIVNDFYLRADMATIVYDIMSRYQNQEGHSVYRCPECDRIYIQKEYGSDEWTCFERRP